MPRNLTGLFSPQSIAVIGASQSPQKVGSIALKNIINSGFGGRVYPVNSRTTDFSQLKFYSSVSQLPEIPDLAIFAIPAAVVFDELLRCQQFGIKNYIIFSAGFKEIGPEGQLLEDKLTDVATQYQLNILGPNCLGFASPRLSLNTTFASLIKKSGNIRLISQSGALAASLFDWCQNTGLGFSDFVTVGNKSILDENDILESWLPDLLSATTTIPIGLYLESISNGRRFFDLISQITPHHPVFVLKPGKSSLAATAMHSHTGAIAGQDLVLQAAFDQAGVIRCSGLSDFFDLTISFAWAKAPLGPQVAVISNAGGPAVITTDAISSHGLELAKFSQVTEQKLAVCLPRIASIINPVDVLGDALADRFGQALEIVLQEKSTQSVLVILTPQLMTQIAQTAEIIGQMSQKYPQPIFCSFVGGGHTLEGQRVLHNYHLPSFSFPEQAISVVASMWQWQNWHQSPTITDSDTLVLPINSIDNLTAQQLLSSLIIPTPPSEIIFNLKDANNFVKNYSYPVVLKLSSSSLLHKSDIGGVITNIDTDSKLSTAFQTLSSKHLDIQIQKQIMDGIEVIIGCKRDPTFGPVMLFGAGGKYVQLLEDRHLHLLPLTLTDAKNLVAKSKIFRFLSGFRDDPVYDLSPLYDTILKLGKLFVTFTQISEIEINPLIITHTSVWAVDPKIILS